MYQLHPEITFKISSRVRGQVTQRQSGISKLYFIDASGARMRIPNRLLKVYDKSTRSRRGDPLGYRIPMEKLPSGESIFTLCTTQNYEIYWKGKLAAELNFTWMVTEHYQKKKKQRLTTSESQESSSQGSL